MRAFQDGVKYEVTNKQSILLMVPSSHFIFNLKGNVEIFFLNLNYKIYKL